MYPRKESQRCKCKSLSPKTSLVKPFSDKEQESKKKLIVNKVLEDIKIRNKKMLERFDLNDKFLKQNINKLIKEENLLGFDYSKFLSKAENELIYQKALQLGSQYNRNYNDTSRSPEKNEIERNKKNNTSLERSINKNNHKNYVSMTNNYDNIINSNSNSNTIIPVSNEKLEELKNLKEKDEWGILAKKHYEEYLEDKISKIQKKEEKKKEIVDTLARQIIEKNQQKYMKKNNDELFNKNLKQDLEIWKNKQERERENNQNKIKDFIDKRDYVYKSI